MNKIACNGLLDNEFGSEVIFLTKTHMFVIDANNACCLAVLPIESDTGQRVAFGPTYGTCFVGSWRENLKAWNYQTSELLWESAIKRITNVEAFGRGQLKVKKDGTLLLDAQNGDLLTEFSWIDMYKHPELQVTAAFEPRQSISITNSSLSMTSKFDWDAFAILDYAWSNEAFVASSPTGDIRAYSIVNPSVLMERPRSSWFNIICLTFNADSHIFFGLATDWQEQALMAIIKISPDFKEITCVQEVRNAPHFCFFDHGRYLLIDDGSVIRVTDGHLVKQLDWKQILNPPPC
jgi:hypothetical protein